MLRFGEEWLANTSSVSRVGMKRVCLYFQTDTSTRREPDRILSYFQLNTLRIVAMFNYLRRSGCGLFPSGLKRRYRTFQSRNNGRAMHQWNKRRHLKGFSER